VLPLLLLVPARAGATLVNPVAEVQNVLVSQESQAEFDAPAMVARVAAATVAYQQHYLTIPLADPQRAPAPNPCTTVLICAVDPRLVGFASQGGISEPVLFTSRTGATLSGHLWATVAGPPKRPGIVIVNGSIIANEDLYWYAAQALARAGFVVLTFDPEGEGLSDQFGQAPDQDEEAFAGTPVIGPQLGGNGLAFYDGAEDAINFLLSTPSAPYEPAPSRTTGTSHAAKQSERVAEGLDSANDPLWQMLDPSEIGIAGHSYGAEAASYVGQEDPRVKAVVAWDNLCRPVQPSPTELLGILQSPINTQPGGLFGLPEECVGAPPGQRPAMTKPALGISSDYLLLPEPYTIAPSPQAKAAASRAYTAAGVDSGQIVIRGGTHYEFNDEPLGAIPQTLRGPDLVTWYTTAWFLKYLSHDPAADQMLLTSRWRNDAAAGKVDPSRDSNVFSYHYLSRLDIHLASGARSDCEDLRAGCTGMVSATADCGPPSYSFVGVDTGVVPATTCTPAAAVSGASHACSSARSVTVRLPAGTRRVAVEINGRRSAGVRGRRSVRVSLVGRPAGTYRIDVIAVGNGRRRTLARTVHTCRVRNY
jgi:dienelactone hydrolase